MHSMPVCLWCLLGAQTLLRASIHRYCCCCSAAVQSTALLGSGMRFIFIENICNDPEILQQNYLNKMMYSPDYKGISTEKVRYVLYVMLASVLCSRARHAMACGQAQTLVALFL